MSIEKHSKVLKNLFQSRKGQELERKASSIIHKGEGIPLLLSPLLLRSYGVGQVDLAITRNKVIFLFECKSGYLGISRAQQKRLRDAGEFISQILKMPTLLRVLNDSFCQK